MLSKPVRVGFHSIRKLSEVDCLVMRSVGFVIVSTSKARPIFAVYRWDLSQLARMSDQLSVWSDSLIKVLAKDTI